VHRKGLSLVGLTQNTEKGTKKYSPENEKCRSWQLASTKSQTKEVGLLFND
jgi:hypothetical protein